MKKIRQRFGGNKSKGSSATSADSGLSAADADEDPRVGELRVRVSAAACALKIKQNLIKN